MPGRGPEPMSEEARQRLDHFLRAQTDWRASCPACGESLVGSLAEIEAHARAHREAADGAP